MGLAKVTTRVLLISNLVSDSEGIRLLLRDKQLQLQQTSFSIAVHCPTRFGIVGIIAGDLLKNREVWLACMGGRHADCPNLAPLPCRLCA